jgi:hypothetical protein
MSKVCRYFETTEPVRAHDYDVLRKHQVGKKRKYTHHAKPDTNDEAGISDCEITEKQFMKARKKIINAKQRGKLDENQELAFKSFKGLHFKNMTAAMKEQIVNMAKDL